MKADPLSITFAALADPTRRAILARLSEGEATVNELAAPHAMSLPVRLAPSAGAGAGRADRQGQVSAVAALPAQTTPLAAAGCAWLDSYRRFLPAAASRNWTRQLSTKPNREDT